MATSSALGNTKDINESYSTLGFILSLKCNQTHPSHKLLNLVLKSRERLVT